MQQPTDSNMTSPFGTSVSSETASSLSSSEYEQMTLSMSQTPPMSSPNGIPFLQFKEKPMSRQRLRYESEGLGSIKGEKWTLENKTKPEVEIVNYVGPLLLIVSCVTADEPYRPHPHQLTSKESVCSQCGQRVRDRNVACTNGGGRCTLTGNCANYYYMSAIHSDTLPDALSGVGLQSVKRNDIQASIENQRSHGIDPYQFYRNQTYTPEAQYNPKKFRLCFQAFINYNNNSNYAVEPLLSPVLSATELRVKHICQCSANVEGGTEMVILGADFSRDLHVRFYEIENQTEEEVWNVLVRPVEIYRSVVIRLMIPPYHSQQIRPNATIYLSLFRPSDQTESPRFKFEYIPNADNRREENAEMIRNLKEQEVATHQQQQQQQEQQQQQASNSIVWNNLNAPLENQQQQQLQQEQQEQQEQMQHTPNEIINDADILDSLLKIIESQHN